MSLGEKISYLRKSRSWRQEDLAEKVGVGKLQVSRWETGRMRPSRQTLKRLAMALGVVYEELLDSQAMSAHASTREAEVPLAYCPVLAEKLRQVHELDPDDQALILRMIDALVRHQELERLLDAGS